MDHAGEEKFPQTRTGKEAVWTLLGFAALSAWPLRDEPAWTTIPDAFAAAAPGAQIAVSEVCRSRPD